MVGAVYIRYLFSDGTTIGAAAWDTTNFWIQCVMLHNSGPIVCKLHIKLKPCKNTI